MTRLTNQSRAKIVNMIIDHKFVPLRAALDQERDRLGAEVYDYEYGPKVPRIAAVQQEFGGQAFPERAGFKVNAGGVEDRAQPGHCPPLPQGP